MCVFALQLYPKRTGPSTNVFPSGAVLESHVTECLADGHGTMTWPNGDTYMVGRSHRSHHPAAAPLTGTDRH